MRIGLLLHPYGEKSPGGLGRSVFEMARNLIELDRENSYLVYFKDREVSRPSFVGDHWTFKGLGSRALWLAFGMDRTLDAYIFFNPIIPLFFFPRKSIVVVHDFAYLELPNQSFKQRCMSIVLYAAHWVSLWKATAIVAVSHATKESVVRHFRISPEKVHVIYNGFIALSDTPQEMKTPPRFFLFAGVLKERKNVAGVIRAFALFTKNNATHELLIAGKQSGAYAESLQQLARELGVGNRVHFLGYVTDAELAYLYSRAEALVFPSFIEGFGMPVLEAMHAGLPVITSNSGALAEVAGDAALLVDPTHPEDIAEAMSRIASDVELKGELKGKGRTRSAQFSWGETAKGLIEVIRSIGNTAR